MLKVSEGNQGQQPYLLHFILKLQPQYDIIQRLINQYSSQIAQQYPQCQILNQQKQEKLFRNKQKLQSINHMSEDIQLRNKILEEIEIKEYEKYYLKAKNSKINFFKEELIEQDKQRERNTFQSFKQTSTTKINSYYLKKKETEGYQFFSRAKSSKNIRKNNLKLNSFMINKNQNNQSFNNTRLKNQQLNRGSQEFTEHKKIANKIKSKCKHIISSTKLDPKLFSIFQIKSKIKQSNLKKASLNDLGSIYKIYKNIIEQKSVENIKSKDNHNQEQQQKFPVVIEEPLRVNEKIQKQYTQKRETSKKLQYILKPYQNSFQRQSYRVNSTQRKIRNNKNKQNQAASFYKTKAFCETKKQQPNQLKDIQLKKIKLSSFHYVLSQGNQKILNMKGDPINRPQPQLQTPTHQISNI